MSPPGHSSRGLSSRAAGRRSRLGGMRLFVLVRHGQSTLNLTRQVNGDPGVTVPLTEQGRAEAAALGLQLAGVPLDLCVHTRFGRTLETAEVALGGRSVPFEVEPLLDDIDIGELEGRTVDDYRTWKDGAHAGRRLPGRREPRRGCAPLRASLRASARAVGGAPPRRLPRDPDPLRAERGRRLRRARRPRALARQLRPVPLRREQPAGARWRGSGVWSMRARGFEPPRPLGHRDLNPARLPVPPRPRG